jgi:D-sedoheptulose 7-phosphate isomerase
LGNEGDVFIPITTSGNSENIIEAVRVANEKKIQTIGLTGNSGGKLDSLCDCIKVPSDEVPRIQECHILIGHILCQIAEEGIFKSSE